MMPKENILNGIARYLEENNISRDLVNDNRYVIYEKTKGMMSIKIWNFSVSQPSEELLDKYASLEKLENEKRHLKKKYVALETYPILKYLMKKNKNKTTFEEVDLDEILDEEMGINFLKNEIESMKSENENSKIKI